MGFQLNKTEFDLVIQKLSSDYDIIAPALMPFEMHHSDQKVYGYRKVTSADEIDINQKTFFSPKEFLFPPRETMFYFMDSEIQQTSVEDKEKIIILRACDLNGIDRLKRIFLNNGDTEDIYFKNKLEHTAFWLLECNVSFDSCFCVSMKSNNAENYSAALKFDGDNILVELNDDRFKKAFKNSGIESNYSFSPVAKNSLKVTLPSIDRINIDIFENDIWTEYTQRCIACGRCNTSCITCSCFTTQDISFDNDRKMNERRRVWTGCHLDDFSLMAGGHDYRTKNGERMRFKTLHKIYDYYERFGVHMCVGCGRCDDVCPEYISFSKCINKLSDVVNDGGE